MINFGYHTFRTRIWIFNIKGKQVKLVIFETFQQMNLVLHCLLARGVPHEAKICLISYFSHCVQYKHPNKTWVYLIRFAIQFTIIIPLQIPHARHMKCNISKLFFNMKLFSSYLQFFKIYYSPIITWCNCFSMLWTLYKMVICPQNDFYSKWRSRPHAVTGGFLPLKTYH